MLVYRTSAHVRAATKGLIGGILLSAVAAFAALAIWPSHAETLGVKSAVAHIRDEGWDRYAPIVLVVAVVLGAVAFAYAIRRARRWRFEQQINRVSAVLPTTDPSMIDPAKDHRAVAIGLPPPRIEWIRGVRGGMPKLRASSPATNIIGLPRLEIAYLRLFNNEHRHVSFVKGAWREFGSVSVLRSAASMTSKEAQHARRVGFEPLFVTSRQQLEAELSAVGIAPHFGVSRVDAGPTRVRVRDRYGAYPMRSILCANSTWRAAVDRLLDTADLVVLDLSGYTERRVGTRYELQRVLDRVPADRLIMLADPKSKNKILEDAIADAWARLSVDSPNAVHSPVPLWIARVDRLVTTTDQQNITRVELVTSRKQTRRLMCAVQKRLSNARPIVREPSTGAPDTSTDDVDPWRAYGLPESQPTPSGTPNGHAAAVAATGPTTSDRPPTRPHDGAHRWRIVGITFAVLAIGVAIASMMILTEESRDSATTTLAPPNTESSADCPTLGEEVLRRGDGIPDPCESVRVAQGYLTILGYPLEIDGRFGEATEAAVQEFQLDHGLTPDGLLGPATWHQIDQMSATS